MGLGQTVRAQFCAATNDGTSTCAPAERDVWFNYTSSDCDQIVELDAALVPCSFSIHTSPGGPVVECQDNPWGVTILSIPFPTMTWTQPADTPYYIRASSDLADAVTFAITQFAIIDTDGDGVCDGLDPCPNRKPGDVNGDGSVDVGDIAAFVLVLLDPGAASADDVCAADVNADTIVDGLDVQGFADLILAP